LTGSAVDALCAGIVSVVSVVLLVHYSPRLSLVAVATTIAAAAVSLSASVPQVKLRRQIRASHGAIKGLLFNVFRGIAKFRLANAERRVFALWAREYAEQRRADLGAREMIGRSKVSSAMCAVAGAAVLCVVNARAQFSGEHALSTGAFLAFMLAFGQLLSSSLTMTAALAGVADIAASYERTAPILRAVPEDTTEPKAEVELDGDIAVHDLFFGYSPHAAPVLRGVSFHITPGEYVALVGPSGCGKSTLFRLLLGFEAPASGAIAYNGVDLLDLDAHSVRRQVGVVLQSGTLLTGTIRDNICGAARLPMEEVWEAARLVGLDDEIRAMPMGMQTLLSATGAGLSGGQRQRLLLARAVALKPRVLLLDEPTSALDNRLQATVTQRLKTLNATRIVIAHRLTTILNADRILVMDRGRIVQSGTHTDLMAQAGLFRQLAERQAI
jgi:ABC-type bacteriocin/lantibiotic exporter with double-glycine peptidase domain